MSAEIHATPTVEPLSEGGRELVVLLTDRERTVLAPFQARDLGRALIAEADQIVYGLAGDGR